MMAADHADDIESVHFAVVHDDSYTYVYTYVFMLENYMVFL